MNCEYHRNHEVQVKCQQCETFMCSECEKEHKRSQKGSHHTTITITQICQTTKQKLKSQINKLSNKIHELNSLGDYEMGETIIDACLKEINEYVHRYFEKIKEDYRKICDTFWNVENQTAIKQLQGKKSVLKGWREILKKNPDKIIDFEVEEIFEKNKMDSDEELLEQSQSFLYTANAPKICFNQMALRRLNQQIGKVIYISQNYALKANKIKKKTLKKTSSIKSYKTIVKDKSEVCCKFIQGTNILYEFILSDPQNSQLAEKPITELPLRKIEFREFVCPMRSVSISVNGQIYLIGGESLKDRRVSRQIWFYERQYNSMRIICLMKKGRVSHCVCTSRVQSQEQIYVFGGKGTKSLEKINLKKKSVEQIGEYSNEIVGASMIQMKNSVYIFGGFEGPNQPNPKIIIFDLLRKKIDSDKIPLNYSQFKIPITPILHTVPLSPNFSEILIIGGYFQHEKSTYPNTHALIYNTDYNYVSQLGKSEIIYPILSNGSADCLYFNQKENKIHGIVDIKRNSQVHGPNLGVIFQYGLKDGKAAIDFFTT